MWFPTREFYWGEEGNIRTPSLFDIPIPASRAEVRTGYNFVLPDQNGWSRSLHFQAAWIAVFTGMVYVASGFHSGRFRRELLPAAAEMSWPALSKTIAGHMRFRPPGGRDARSYNVLQRLAYLGVVFGLFPLMIWTGLAMSPAIAGAFPFLADSVGGQQSARTLHFLATIILVLFVAVHILMVFLAGFRSRMNAMITGRTDAPQEQR